MAEPRTSAATRAAHAHDPLTSTEAAGHTRRSVIAGAAALPALAALPAAAAIAPGDAELDAELVELERRWRAAIAAEDVTNLAMNRAEDRFFTLLRASYRDEAAEAAAARETSVEEARAADRAAMKRTCAIEDAIIAAPAATIVGAAVKARLVLQYRDVQDENREAIALAEAVLALAGEEVST